MSRPAWWPLAEKPKNWPKDGCWGTPSQWETSEHRELYKREETEATNGPPVVAARLRVALMESGQLGAPDARPPWKKLAVAWRVPLTALRNLGSGRAMPTAEAMDRIAIGANIPVCYLLRGSPRPAWIPPRESKAKELPDAPITLTLSTSEAALLINVISNPPNSRPAGLNRVLAALALALVDLPKAKLADEKKGRKAKT